MLFIRRGESGLAEYDTDDLSDVIAHALPQQHAEGDEIVRRVPGPDGDVRFVPLARLETFGESKLWALCKGAMLETSDHDDLSGSRPICAR